jgi:hypothetical protein
MKVWYLPTYLFKFVICCVVSFSMIRILVQSIFANSSLLILIDQGNCEISQKKKSIKWSTIYRKKNLRNSILLSRRH